MAPLTRKHSLPGETCYNTITNRADWTMKTLTVPKKKKSDISSWFLFSIPLNIFRLRIESTTKNWLHFITFQKQKVVLINYTQVMSINHYATALSNLIGQQRCGWIFYKSNNTNNKTQAAHSHRLAETLRLTINRWITGCWWMWCNL